MFSGTGIHTHTHTHSKASYKSIIQIIQTEDDINIGVINVLLIREGSPGKMISELRAVYSPAPSFPSGLLHFETKLECFVVWLALALVYWAFPK